MENTSNVGGYFDPGIKHQLFENFRRYKIDHSVSKNDNALKISSVEQQILQGYSIDTNNILEINKTLLKYLQNNTLYNKFDENYMNSNPFGFFQEGLDLFFKDFGAENGSVYDEEQIYICKIDDKIYITADDRYQYRNVILELSLLNDLKNYPSYKNLMLYLFAMANKSGMFNYFGESRSFEMVNGDYWIDENGKKCSSFDDEYDEDTINSIFESIEAYQTGYYRKLMDNVSKESSKLSISDILGNIKKYSDKTKDSKLISHVNEILNRMYSINWDDLRSFIEFQYRTFDILDTDKEKYEERMNHLMEFNLFQYDYDGDLEQYYNSIDDSTLNEGWFQPYLIPMCFSENGSVTKYAEIWDAFYYVLETIITIERYVYKKIIDKGI